MKYPWVFMQGRFEETDDGITFKGGEYEVSSPSQKPQGTAPSDEPAAPEPPPEKRPVLGKAICNQRFTEGKIHVQVSFSQVDVNSVAEVIVQYDLPSTSDSASDDLLNIGLGAGGLFSFRQWTTAETGTQAHQTPSKGWRYLRAGGDRQGLQADRWYDLVIDVKGSTLRLGLNGVEVASAQAPFQFAGKQTGIFCVGRSDIRFRNFSVDAVRPQAFVVMQFNTPEYEELFKDVIAPACEQMGLVAYRADQTYSPGVVIADITKQILDSRVIIAEITPVNGNVYYEVGYADAVKKPVILIADRKVQALPFDVRPYRAIFYDNTIGGKSKIEEALKKFLGSVMSEKR
jgi:hypothetical protein